jgi:hypothetical protein
MKPPASDHVTLVERFRITRPLGEVAALLRLATARLEREGVRALVAMNFYLDEESGDLGAVITFEDATQFLAHIEMVSRWPEFQAFANAIRLVEMRIHGRVSPEVEAWIRQFDGTIVKLERHIAGFVR